MVAVFCIFSNRTHLLELNLTDPSCVCFRYPGHAWVDCVGLSLGSIALRLPLHRLLPHLLSLPAFHGSDQSSTSRRPVHKSGPEGRSSKGADKGGEEVAAAAMQLLHVWPAKVSISLPVVSIDVLTDSSPPRLAGAPRQLSSAALLGWHLSASLKDLRLVNAAEAGQQQRQARTPPVRLELTVGRTEAVCSRSAVSGTALPRDAAVVFSVGVKWTTVAVSALLDPRRATAQGAAAVSCSFDLELASPHALLQQQHIKGLVSAALAVAALLSDPRLDSNRGVGGSGRQAEEGAKERSGFSLRDREASQLEPDGASDLSQAAAPMGDEAHPMGHVRPSPLAAVPPAPVVLAAGPGAFGSNRSPALSLAACVKLRGGLTVTLAGGDSFPTHALLLDSADASVSSSSIAPRPPPSSADDGWRTRRALFEGEGDRFVPSGFAAAESMSAGGLHYSDRGRGAAVPSYEDAPGARPAEAFSSSPELQRRRRREAPCGSSGVERAERTALRVTTCLPPALGASRTDDADAPSWASPLSEEVLVVQRIHLAHVSRSLSEADAERRFDSSMVGGREEASLDGEGDACGEPKVEEEVALSIKQARFELQPRVVGPSVDAAARLLANVLSLLPPAAAPSDDDDAPRAAATAAAAAPPACSRLLTLLDVELHSVEVVIGHDHRLDPRFAEAWSSSTADRPGGGVACLNACHSFQLLSAHVQASPSQGWVVGNVTDLHFKQYASAAVETAAVSGLPPPTDATPLSLEQLDLRARLRVEDDVTESAAPLIKLSLQAPRLHFEADTALLLLGAARFYAGLAARLAEAAAAAGPLAAAGAGPLPPPSRGQQAAPLRLHEEAKAARQDAVVEVRAQEAELSCVIGARDLVSVKMQAISCSGWLQEAAIDTLLVSANGRQILGASFASVALPRRDTAARPSGKAGPASEAAEGLPRTAPGAPLTPARASGSASGTPIAGVTGSLRSVRTRQTAPSEEGSDVGTGRTVVVRHDVIDEGDWEGRGDKGGVHAEDGGSAEQGSSPSKAQQARSREGGDPLTATRARGGTGCLLLGPVLDAPLASLGPGREAALVGAAGGVAGAAARSAARRRAARERFALSQDGGAAAAAHAAAAGSGRHDPEAGEEEEEEVVLLPVEVVLDQAVICVPYDESPTRIYELEEVWEEAVGQVHD